MWELDYEESWALKNWCFWTVVLDKDSWASLELKDQTSQSSRKWVLNILWKDWCWSWSWLTLWPPDVKNWLIGKDPDAGKDWRWEETGMTEDEMVGWHHWLNGHEFEQSLGVGDGQGSLACYSPWDRKESDTTKWLNWTENAVYKHFVASTIIDFICYLLAPWVFLVCESSRQLLSLLCQIHFWPTNLGLRE